MYSITLRYQTVEAQVDRGTQLGADTRIREKSRTAEEEARITPDNVPGVRRAGAEVKS